VSEMRIDEVRCFLACEFQSLILLVYWSVGLLANKLLPVCVQQEQVGKCLSGDPFFLCNINTTASVSTQAQPHHHSTSERNIGCFLALPVTTKHKALVRHSSARLESIIYVHCHV